MRLLVVIVTVLSNFAAILASGCPRVYWLVEQGCPADPQQLEIVVIVTVLGSRWS